MTAAPARCWIRRDHKNETVAKYFDGLRQCARKVIKSVAMDMWPALINDTSEAISNAQNKIAFDKFQVASYLCDVVDKVRKKERCELLNQSSSILTDSKCSWLRNPDIETEIQRHRADQSKLRSSNLKTAKAWAVRGHATCLRNYVSRGYCERERLKWYGWAIHTRINTSQSSRSNDLETALWHRQCNCTASRQWVS